MEGRGGIIMTRVRGSKARIERKTVISDTEFQQILEKAAEIKDKFFRLRAKALLCILRLSGKRRGEVAVLGRDDFKVKGGLLHITFTVLKKRKKEVLKRRSPKAIPLSDPLTKPILEWLEYLESLKTDTLPAPKFFLPRVKSVFGHGYIMRDAHISGRQVFNIVRGCTETVWPHLFRETVASDVVKQDPSIIAAFKVKKRLDLKDIKTGFRYLDRFAVDIIDREGRFKSTEKVDVIEREA